MHFHSQEPGAPLTPLLAVKARAENTTMAKIKKKKRRTSPTDDTHKPYSRTYAARLAKQVADELNDSRRVSAPRKKSRSKA
jgi:hypothetical protein